MFQHTGLVVYSLLFAFHSCAILRTRMQSNGDSGIVTVQRLLERDTVVTWIGHGTFHIKTPEGKRILIDAFVDSCPTTPENWKSLAREQLDAIFITHGHNDHIADLFSLARDTQATIICQYDIEPWLVAQGIDQQRIIGFNKGGTIEIAGLRATMVSAQHTSSFNTGNGVLAMGEPIGYVLRFSNGFTLYHTGDTTVTMDMQITADLYAPDLVILPIGDYFTMGPREAAYALRLLRAKYAIPEHWEAFPVLTGTPQKLEAACQELGLTTRIITLQPGESVA